MNKKELTEADIQTKFITPALVGSDGSKWNVMTQLREEVYFTKGRVIVHGKTTKRGEAKKADYLLYYKPNIPIAMIEANEGPAKVGFWEIRAPILRSQSLVQGHGRSSEEKAKAIINRHLQILLAAKIPLCGQHGYKP